MQNVPWGCSALPERPKRIEIAGLLGSKSLHTAYLFVVHFSRNLVEISRNFVLAGQDTRGPLPEQTNIVRGTFETDPISALGLPAPVSIETGSNVATALEAVQRRGQGYVLVVEEGHPRGIMSEREVLMQVVARDVKYNSDVMDFASPIPVVFTESGTIAHAVQTMVLESIDNIPIVDTNGYATAVLRGLDVIHFLAEAFPQELLNLPPEPHQTMPKPEGG